jgi:hypothetical protein
VLQDESERDALHRPAEGGAAPIQVGRPASLDAAQRDERVPGGGLPASVQGEGDALMSRRALAMGLLVLGIALPGAALASWQNGGSGSSFSRAKTMPAGNTPTASVSGRTVTVSWSASSLSGGGSVDGYLIRRYDTSGQEQAIAANCSGTITALSCTEKAVPTGSWKYTVTPVLANWLGAESSQSSAVTVGSPTLTLDSSTVTSLPTTLTGQITNFVDDQTVSFRLDNPSTGQTLSGSISPSPVPTNGAASVSVTIPTGVSNGSHTVYAIGDQGDTASAGITVTVPTTISTSTWSVSDASSGTASDQSATTAFLNDGRSANSGNFATTFSTSRYLQADYNAPLYNGFTPSSVNINVNFAATRAQDTVCYYFEVRRASTDTVIGTHGSAAAPSDCQTGVSFKLSTTPLPEVTSAAIANDLRIRTFVRNSGNRPVNVDLATVSGIAGGQSFTLYDIVDTDASSGSPISLPWGLAAQGDGVFYSSAGNWATAFSSTRFLQFTFPSYVPSGDAVTGVTFSHGYRSATAATTCYYFETYSGTTLIGTHGSSASPVSCNSSNTTWVTDAIPLPEVNTAALANGLKVKMYVRRSPSGRSQHDQAGLSITFVP